jgi:hypothetical protein
MMITRRLVLMGSAAGLAMASVSAWRAVTANAADAGPFDVTHSDGNGTPF